MGKGAKNRATARRTVSKVSPRLLTRFPSSRLFPLSERLGQATREARSTVALFDRNNNRIMIIEIWSLWAKNIVP